MIGCFYVNIIDGKENLMTIGKAWVREKVDLLYNNFIKDDDCTNETSHRFSRCNKYYYNCLVLP